MAGTEIGTFSTVWCDAAMAVARLMVASIQKATNLFCFKSVYNAAIANEEHQS
ncbi:hypothetical protein O9992_24825 [Vibrio lentus]|nr:hypothetical protein [Vibrio lentus]